MHNHRVTVWQLTDDAYAERFGVTKHGPTIKNFLSDIADQIEREAQAPFSRVRVLAVISDMESRVSDEGGSFGALVARWAMELRGAVCSGERDPAEDVSVSAYDLLPEEEREAIAWVREHGGLDHVRVEWSSRVPHDLYERRRQRLLDHIAECETALGRRNHRIEELGKTIEFFQLNNSNFRHLLADVAERLGFTRYGDDYEPEDLLDTLDRRLMPEGCEWPRYDTGEPVRIGGTVADELGHGHVVTSVELHDDGADLHWNHAEPEECVWVGHGEPVRRPAVLAADGDPLEVGQTVWVAENGNRFHVVRLCDDGLVQGTLNGDLMKYLRPERLTHQRPVLDADGVPINVGDTVYELGENYPPFVVGRLPEPGAYRSVRVVYPSGAFTFLDPERLTHTKSEPPDSWERIEEDKGLNPFDYCKKVGHKLWTFDNAEEIKASDLVRRCKALAERERGE